MKSNNFANMFRKITATILLMAFVCQTFASPFIILDYFVNTAAYTRNCINKAKPKLQCNGKCQMMKKIQGKEKKEQQNPERKADLKEQVLSSRSFFCTIQPICIIPHKAKAFDGIYPLTDISYTFFHPPQA